MTPALLLAAACLLGRPAFAETGRRTLAELLARERIDFQITHSEDLDKPVIDGDVLDTLETRVVATYVVEGNRESDRLYVFRRAKPQGNWKSAEVRWPESSDTSCRGGSITDIAAANGFLYLTGHINPSAACTMVLTEKLALQDTLYGWPVARFQDGRIVYQHSEIHFAPTHYAELSIYDPVSRRSRQIYPPSPAPPLRRQYIEKVRAAYERCCVDHPPADCGGAFAVRNHHCNPELFENSIGEVIVNDATDSLAFRARFEDIAGEDEAVYFFRHLREGAPEVREIWAGAHMPGITHPLGDYLTAGFLSALFERTPESLPLKAWHVSPDPSPMSSTAYPFVSWLDVLRIKVGMPEPEVVKIVGQRLQYYHHPVNAILFSRTPEGQPVEVALKRSPEGAVEDISYKLQEAPGSLRP
jgi:hypothetical protein